MTRTEPVSLKTLHEHLPDHKTVKNEHALRSAVFHGGLADDARAEAWKFFLNYRWFVQAHGTHKRAEHGIMVPTSPAR